MNRNPENDPRAGVPAQQPAGGDALNELVNLGMKSDALKEARRRLKESPMAAEAFNSATDAILTLADGVKPWTTLVESAHERLPRRERQSARHSIIFFRASCKDQEGVLRAMPKRFSGKYALVELAFVTEAALALNRKDLVRKLAKRLPRAIEDAEHPMMQAQLLLCLSECSARDGRWGKAIATAIAAQSCETFNREAAEIIVEIHVARALRALQHGFRRIEEFNKNFDPETELKLPGNDKAVQEQAAKEFRRLQKILEKIVPKERQRELGLA